MPDQFRTVNVPTVGPVNFPASMSDEDVASAIQKNFPHLAPPHTPDAFDAMQAIHLAPQDQGKFSLNPANPAGSSAAPEWNDALKNMTPWKTNPAVPSNAPRTAPTIEGFLDTNPTAQRVKAGIQKTAGWLNTPLASQIMVKSGGFDPDTVADVVRDKLRNLRENNMALPPTGESFGAGVGGAEQALWDAMNGSTTPLNLGTLALLGIPGPEGAVEGGELLDRAREVGTQALHAAGEPELSPLHAMIASMPQHELARIANAYMAGQMIYGAGQGTAEGIKGLEKGDIGEGVRGIASGTISGVFGGLLGAHLMGGELARMREGLPEEGPSPDATKFPAPLAGTSLRALRDVGTIQGPWIDRMLEQESGSSRQMELPLRGNAIPAPPVQRELPFSQFRLPPQEAAMPRPSVEQNGQMRLFPNEGRQLELQPEERTPQVAEGPSAQQELMFPPNPWQMPLDFDQPTRSAPPTEATPKAEPTPPAPTTPVAPTPEAATTQETPHQAINPSINPLRSTEALMHPLVSKMLRLRQLSQAATHRLNVQFALHSIAGREEQIDSRGRITGTIFQPNENPLAPQSKTWDQLSKGRKQMVGSVAKVLGIDPRVLGSDQNPAGKWRLTDQQVTDLRAALKQGIHVQQATPEEAPFGSLAHPPLAAINTVNAKAAGIPNVRDLWAQTTQAFRERRAARLKDAKSFAAGTDVTGSQAAAQGLRVGTARGMQHEGMLQQELGKDVETLQDEHDAMQAVVAKHLKATQAKLKELIPTWQKLRAGEATPSPLAQKVAALGKESKSLLPKELYAPEHLTPQAAESATGTIPQEPTATPEATSGPSTPQAPEGDLTDKINKLMQVAAKRYGEQTTGAFPSIFDAISAKFPNPEHQAPMFYRMAYKYMKGLEQGNPKALDDVLKTIQEFRQRSGDSTTNYANPVIPILNKIFGLEKSGQPALGRESMGNWAQALPDHPITQLAKQLQASGSVAHSEQARAWLDNELGRVTRAWYETPGTAQAKFQQAQALLKRAWDAWTIRPGLDTWDHLLGQRNLMMMSTGLKLAEFTDSFARAFPNAERRAAIVAWAEAHKDPTAMGPFRQRLSDDQAVENLGRQASDLEQSQFVARRNRLYARVYRNAMNLTDKEKEWAEKYRRYDEEMVRFDRENGLEHEAALDYFEHIWHKDNFTKDAIAGLRSGAGFGTSANFERMRQLGTYFEGLARGLRPNSLDPLYLISARAMASARVLANRQLVGALRELHMPDGSPAAELDGFGVQMDPTEDKKGAILVRQGTPKAARDAKGNPYVHIDHPAFRDWKWLGTAKDGTNVLGLSDMVVHPDIAAKVRRELLPSRVRENPIGRIALAANSLAKQTLLSLSLFHPVQLTTHALEHGMVGAVTGTNLTGEGQLVPRFIRALNPLSNEKFIDLNDPIQQMLVVHGLRLRMFDEDDLWDEGLMRKGGVMGTPFMGGAWGSMHNLIFNRFLPNLKMTMGQDILERNMNRYHAKWKAEELQKAGLTPAKASPEMQAQASIAAQSRIYRLTATQVNTAFGGIDWSKLPVGKTGQDILRLAFLAPDFLAARAGFVVDAMRPGGAESRQALGMGFAAQYLLARGLNAWLNNGDPKNDIDDWNRIVIGHKSYSLRSVQGDMSEAIFQPQRFAEHRLNPFWRPAIEAATGRDAWGNQLQPGQLAVDTVKNFMPIPLQGMVDNIAPHFWANLRKPKYNENELDTVMEGLLGIQPKRYLTPAESFTYSEFDKIPKAQPNTPLEWEQKNSFKYLRDQFKQGKLSTDDIANALNGQGKYVPGIGKLVLKPNQVRYLQATQHETRLVSEARQLGPEQVYQAWLKGDPSEKLQLLPVAWVKATKLPPDMAQKITNQLNDFLSNLTLEQQEKANAEAQAELTWEQSN